MKHLFLFILMSACGLFVHAQADMFTGITQNEANLGTSPQSKAQWDLQTSFNSTLSAGGSTGMAGVVFFNNEFWVSKWQTDTLIRFDNSGTMIEKFLVAGLTGVRAITTNGTYLYMATNTNTIYRVDPVTKTLAPPHITSASVNPSRFLTYDATLDGGAGGFWTGNFNTDIDAISMSGAVLTTIPAATHTLTGMYGAAVDRISSGGPYLWVFHQGGTNNTQITAIQLTTGLPSALTYDMFPPLQTAHGLSSCLAGGACITNQISAGTLSFVGVAQGTPSNVVFAIELDPANQPDDISGENIVPTRGYTQIPVRQVTAETFDVTFTNTGLNPADTVYIDLNYYFNGSLVGSDQIFAVDVLSGATITNTTNPYTPFNGQGTYTAEAILSTSSDYIDEAPENDTLRFDFVVTDSIYARDNNVATGTPYTLATGSWSYVASMFELITPDTLKGVIIVYETPKTGDSTYAVAYGITAGLPLTQTALGDLVIIDSTVNQYYLPFLNPVPLTAGEYAFGCYKDVDTDLGLAQSSSVFTPDVNFYYTSSSSTWSISGVYTARFIRPVFKAMTGTGIADSENPSFKLYPVPANDVVHVVFDNKTTQDQLVTVSDQTGRVVLNQIVAPNVMQLEMNVSELEPGIYFLTKHNMTQSETIRLIVE